MRGQIGSWAILAFAPFLVTFAYLQLIASRSAGSDQAMLVLAVLIGVIGIWIAPWTKRTKAIATFVYVPVASAVLAAFALTVFCLAGNCL